MGSMMEIYARHKPRLTPLKRYNRGGTKIVDRTSCVCMCIALSSIILLPTDRPLRVEERSSVVHFPVAGAPSSYLPRLPETQFCQYTECRLLRRSRYPP